MDTLAVTFAERFYSWYEMVVEISSIFSTIDIFLLLETYNLEIIFSTNKYIPFINRD